MVYKDKLRNYAIRTGKSYKRYYMLILMFIPVLAYFMIFQYYPMYGVILAFKDYNMKLGITSSPWVGFENFEYIFSYRMFLLSLRNTVVISFMRLVCGFPAPIILALLFNELRYKAFKNITQTISYLPHFLSWVVLSGIITIILSPEAGPINAVINMLGGKPVHFLVEPGWFRWILVITGIWKEVGWGTVIYLAAISGINPSIYESAVIDGANRFKQAIHITIPSILPTAAIMLILSLGNLLNAGFDQIFNLKNSMVREVGEILDITVYNLGFENVKYEVSTAMGLFKSLINMVLVITVNAVVRKMTHREMGLW